MNTKLLRSGLRALSTLVAICGVAALPASSIGAASAGSYSIGWHNISSGAVTRAHSSCYRLSGSIGQATVTPGIVMSTNYTLFSGFWTAAPIAVQDQIFFDGFEDCKQ
jgi:hypothetical protein